MIPKIIHQIWIQGYDNLPSELKIKHETIKTYNPDYRVILWDSAKIEDLLKKYDKISKFYNDIANFSGFVKIFQSQSDVARLVILYEYGGFYLDIDYYCPLSFDKLYKEDDELIVVGSEYKILKYIPIIYHPKYGASFIGIKKKHELFLILFDELVQQNNRDIIGIFFDKFLQKNNYSVTIIDPKYVSSHTCCEIGCCYTPKESSSLFGRSLLIFISCKKNYIIFFIFLILTIAIIYLLLRRK